MLLFALFLFNNPLAESRGEDLLVGGLLIATGVLAVMEGHVVSPRKLEKKFKNMAKKA
jgi:hypothetical protein